MNSGPGKAARQYPLDAARARQVTDEFDSIDWSAIVELAANEELVDPASDRRDGHMVRDPRNDELVVFTPSRAKRPHDYAKTDGEERTPVQGTFKSEACPICSGATTPIVDIVPLSTGFSFVNFNLYPIVRPSRRSIPGRAVGLHLLQWSSNVHDDDIDTLDVADRYTVLRRLTEIEGRLLAVPGYPAQSRYVSVIKNVGAAVGGSLAHGHQQIVLSSEEPRRVRENRAFLERTGDSFAGYLAATIPAELVVNTWQTGALVVPPHMRRPYDLVFYFYSRDLSDLRDLDDEQVNDLASAYVTATGLFKSVFTSIKREAAFNVLFHTGVGRGIYVEFLPYSQEEGGYEKLGMSVCQADPSGVAADLRALCR